MHWLRLEKKLWAYVVSQLGGLIAANLSTEHGFEDFTAVVEKGEHSANLAGDSLEYC